MTIEPGWVTAGIVFIINSGAVFYGAGKFAQRMNGVDHKATKAHNRLDVVEEKQDKIAIDIAEVRNDVKWLVKERQNGGGE